MVQYTYKGYSRARELCVWLLMARRGQSIKIDIGKPINKSITIDKANLTIIDCIDQSIKIDTHTVLGLKVVFHSRMNFFSFSWTEIVFAPLHKPSSSNINDTFD